MALLRCTHVEVYVFRRRLGRVEFLALRRSPDRAKLPGVWQPVTGRLEGEEPALHAAVREVLEETGLSPRRWWTLETVTLFFDSLSNATEVLPLFAAEVGPQDSVTLSDEHDAQRFLSAREAGRRFLWESQRCGLEAVRRQVLRGGALAKALEVTHWLPGRAAAPSHRRRLAR